MIRLIRRRALALLLAPTIARAHEGLHASGMTAVVTSARRDEDKVIEVGLTLTNTTGQTVTLRDVTCDEAMSTQLLRRSSLFGVEQWSKADLIRIDIGEEISLALPN